MRLLTVSLLAAVMLLFSAANASAYRVFFANYTGPASGTSDTISVEIHLDTEGQSSILLSTIGVVFDNTVLEYLPVLSDANDYVLYTAGTGATPLSFLAPAIPNGGHVYDPPELILPDQVNVDQHAFKVTPTSAVSSDETLATLFFHVIAADLPANSEIWLTVGPTQNGLTRGGTVFQLGDNSRPTVAVAAPINVPEPAVLSLSLAALIALYGIHSRRRGA